MEVHLPYYISFYNLAPLVAGKSGQKSHEITYKYI